MRDGGLGRLGRGGEGERDTIRDDKIQWFEMNTHGGCLVLVLAEYIQLEL
jgi:hypothetical protein